MKWRIWTALTLGIFHNVQQMFSWSFYREGKRIFLISIDILVSKLSFADANAQSSEQFASWKAMFKEKNKSKVKMLLVGCCILLCAAQCGTRIQPGRGGGEGRFPLYLPWSESNRMGCVLRLSCRSAGSSLASSGCIFCCVVLTLCSILCCPARRASSEPSSAPQRGGIICL